MRIGLSAIVLSALASPLFGADSDLLRVLPPGQTPDDPRYTVHSIDSPADFTGRFADKAAWEKRAAFLKRQVLVANGLWPMPEKVPLNAVVHGKIDRDDYTIEKVYFTSLPGHYVTGNLYRPKNATGKSPVVLCPHGHWNNGRLLWTADKAAQKELDSGAEQWLPGAQSPLQARCAMLARMGCIVFFYDMVGYADSNKLVHRKGMTDVESVLRLQSQMGLQTWNSIRAVDFVTSLPDVDTSRIAVTGASGGGTQTFLLAACDPRITVAFPAVMVGMNMQGGCVCENAPLLRIGTNNVEITALAAPRPVAASAANDWTRDLETRGLPELKLIYKLYGQPDLVAAKHFSFPHNYNQVSRTYMYEWLNTHLNLGQKSPIAEKPYVPVPPAELSVWDDKHPVPPDALENDALRKRMTELSDKQLTALVSDLPGYRKVVGPALAAMVASEYPTPTGVRVVRHSGPLIMDNVIVERGLIERSADGTKVPYAAGFPAQWNGNVVIWVRPDGKQGLLNEQNEALPEVKAILATGSAIVSPDLFWTGEFLPDGKSATAPTTANYAPKSNPPYPAFNLGYNRSVIGNRVHDLLSVVAMVRGWKQTQTVAVIADGKAGPAALLTKAIANGEIDVVAADLGGFDFDRVTEGSDEMLLPGALKYGGIYGFVPLCENGKVFLTGARKTGRFEVASRMKNVTMEEGEQSAQKLLERTLEAK